MLLPHSSKCPLPAPPHATRRPRPDEGTTKPSERLPGTWANGMRSGVRSRQGGPGGRGGRCRTGPDGSGRHGRRGARAAGGGRRGGLYRGFRHHLTGAPTRTHSRESQRSEPGQAESEKGDSGGGGFEHAPGPGGDGGSMSVGSAIVAASRRSQRQKSFGLLLEGGGQLRQSSPIPSRCGKAAEGGGSAQLRLGGRRHRASTRRQRHAGESGDGETKRVHALDRTGDGARKLKIGAWSVCELIPGSPVRAADRHGHCIS
jgi:hypothetical protein